MFPPRRLRLRDLWLCLLACVVPPALAAENSDLESDLRLIDAEIEKTDSKLQGNQSQQTAVQADLRDLDAAAAEVSGRLHKLNVQVAQTETELRKIEADIDRSQTRLTEQRALLRRHTRVLHQLGDADPLQYLFGGQNALGTDQTMRYFGYLTRARRAVIEEAGAVAVNLTRLHNERNRERERRQEARDEITTEREALTVLADERRSLLAALTREGSNQAARLSALREDRLQLSGLLEELAAQYSDEPVVPFANRQGALPWPTQGTLRSAFRKGNIAGRPNRGGWFISAEEGTPVFPVHPGRVAFAGWFRGLGYLTIVDHGDEYLTLYAHAGSLLLEVEDRVQTDQPLAVAGSSGGSLDPGIYFELHVAGTPADPSDWLLQNGG